MTRSRVNHGALGRRLGRFSLTGLGSTGFHAAIALWLIGSGDVSPPVANGLAFCMATIFSYTANTLWSFSSALHGKNFQRFLVVSVSGFLLSIALAWFAEQMGWPPIAGIGLVVMVVPGLSFWLHSRWTYRAAGLD